LIPPGSHSGVLLNQGNRHQDPHGEQKNAGQQHHHAADQTVFAAKQGRKHSEPADEKQEKNGTQRIQQWLKRLIRSMTACTTISRRGGKVD